jgi:hypothetical protein
VFGACQRNPRRSRHDKRRYCRAWHINQPRQNCDKEHTREIVERDKRPSVEEMSMIEIDDVKPKYDADERADEQKLCRNSRSGRAFGCSPAQHHLSLPHRQAKVYLM